MARYRNFDGALGAGADTQAVRPALDDVRSRRAGLKAALSALELALAAPFANRAEWVMHVRDSLDAVHDVWTRHIVETEAPGAFLDELVTEAPRLATPASRLRREHSDILATIVRGAPVEAKSAEQVNAAIAKLEKGSSVTFQMRRGEQHFYATIRVNGE